MECPNQTPREFVCTSDLNAQHSNFLAGLHPVPPEEAKEEAQGLTADSVKADTAVAADSAAAPAVLDKSEAQKLWTPVIDQLNDYDQPVSNSLFYIFLAGIVGGLVALFTPCVWPIIPMTVSFFLKRNKSR